jgi:BirA family biotin operon repressor/biotin-[acetyl-CoA-carboxylase] ligase
MRHVHFDSLDSTQTLAESIPDEYVTENSFFAITAVEQTKGRGQVNTKWDSPPGNLYVSYIFYLPTSIMAYSVYVSTLSVFHTLKQLSDDIKPTIKWFNDVYLNNMKVSGSLINSSGDEKMSKIIMGIGININSTKDDFALLPEASSIFIETGKEYKVEEIFSNLTKNLISTIRSLVRYGFNPLYNQLKENFEFLGEEVKILDKMTFVQIYSGIFKSFNIDGSVTLLKNGIEEKIHDGKMRKL